MPHRRTVSILTHERVEVTDRAFSPWILEGDAGRPVVELRHGKSITQRSSKSQTFLRLGTSATRAQNNRIFLPTIFLPWIFLPLIFLSPTNLSAPCREPEHDRNARNSAQRSRNRTRP